MAKLTVEGRGTFDIEDGKRLVLAIEDSDIDILHRCGGFARCTTCRVQFSEGEPDQMTVAEHDKLKDQGNLGEFRLSCQIICNHDMTLEPLMTLTSSGLDDPGSRPQDSITPEPEWMSVPQA